MNPVAFYDSETTGLPLFKEPSEDPRQPHIVQLGAVVIDLDTWKTVASLDVICRPDGWTIPDDMTAIHGITTEHALDVGVPEALAVEMLLDLVGTRKRIAHNETFDARMVRIACMRHFTPQQADEWKAGPAECTQILATPILKLPPTPKMRAAGFTKYKSANLREAHLFFTGRQLDGAHSAMADARGCARVYRAIKAGQTEAAAAAVAA